MKKIKFKQGEGKSLVFNVGRGGIPFAGLSAAPVLTFVVKKDKRDDEALIQKTKDDFAVEVGMARVGITSSETAAMAPGIYVGELTIALGPADTTKSLDLVIEIERAVSL